MYKRIEELLGKQLALYATEEAEVMQLQERVAESQRFTRIVSLLFINVFALIVNLGMCHNNFSSYQIDHFHHIHGSFKK